MVIAGAAVFASMLAVGFGALWSDCRRRLSACARMVAELERGRVATAAKVQQADEAAARLREVLDALATPVWRRRHDR
ncbi:MAG: hypothetical protein WB710_09890, partial [Stellaceae bacterium]